MEYSTFSQVTQEAIARGDLWHGLWLVFISFAIAVGWLSHSDRVSLLLRGALGASFAAFAVTLGFWLLYISVQRVALHKLASSIVDTAGAVSSSREVVEASMMRLHQASVVDSISSPDETLWLCAYVLISVGTISSVALSCWKRWQRVSSFDAQAKN